MSGEKDFLNSGFQLLIVRIVIKVANVIILQDCQNNICIAQIVQINKISKLSKKFKKNQNCQILSIVKNVIIKKNVKKCLYFGQVMFPHHSDQVSQRSQVPGSLLSWDEKKAEMLEKIFPTQDPDQFFLHLIGIGEN